MEVSISEVIAQWFCTTKIIIAPYFHSWLIYTPRKGETLESTLSFPLSKRNFWKSFHAQMLIKAIIL